jgi:hypothetical protein
MMPQREDREALQRAAGEHVEHAQNAALLLAEQVAQFYGSIPGTGMCAPIR